MLLAAPQLPGKQQRRIANSHEVLIYEQERDAVKPKTTLGLHFRPLSRRVQLSTGFREAGLSPKHLQQDFPPRDWLEAQASPTSKVLSPP